jgi:SAM-dependent methyltransferase
LEIDMNDKNRWAEDAYPPDYRKEVDDAINFSGLSSDFFLRSKADCVVSILEEFGLDASKALCLDIGCGIGAMHPPLKNRVSHLAGVDISAEAVEGAATVNPWVEYKSYDGTRLPYEDASFDFCFATCVMHHVPPAHWESFMAEAARVTRPNGILAVFEMNPLNPLTRLAMMRCAFDHDAVRLWPSQVRKLMLKGGFQPVMQHYLFFMPLDMSWARKIDRALSWLPMGAQYVVCGRRPMLPESSPA